MAIQQTTQQKQYEETLATIMRLLREARNMNRDAHIDLLKEVQKSLNSEIADLDVIQESEW